MRPEFRFRIAPNWPYVGKMTMTSQFLTWSHRQVFDLFLFFWRICVFSPVKFSYWFRFYVNTITGSGFMTIFFFKRLIRNPEIGNTPVWVLPNIWRLGWVRDTILGTNVSNKLLLNAAKCQGYSFYRFWVIKGKPTGMGGSKNTPSLLPRLVKKDS